MDLHAVEPLIREVARSELLSRHRHLSADQIHEKGRGDVVTDADLASERALTDGLRAILPGSRVVGEEGVHADPDRLGRVADAGDTWIVDPLDGTRHFAAGEDHFGIMVTLVRDGRAEAAWIYLPVPDRLAFARRGAGAMLDGTPHRVPPAPTLAGVRGVLFTKYMPPDLRDRLDAHADDVNAVLRPSCAAERYVAVLTGEEHFSVYLRTLPWDHSAGALIVDEAGGHVARWDGSPYRVADVDGQSLLVAASRELWTALADRLFA